MIVITVLAGGVEIAVLMHMNRNIQDVWILVKCLLYAIAMMYVPLFLSEARPSKEAMLTNPRSKLFDIYQDSQPGKPWSQLKHYQRYRIP